MLLISTSAAQMVLPVEIQLFKGADNSDNQDLRAGILIFLKGNATQKQQLMEKPERWASMEVWGIRNRHMKTGLPPQYVFYLKCLAKNCSHPLCQRNSDLELPSTWFPGGPSLDYVPLPITDPFQPWGSTNCSKCEKTCYGHFLSPEEALKSSTTPMKPPSQILKAYDKLKDKDFSDAYINEMEKATLLPPEEVGYWFKHLKNIRRNRRRGTQKAAQTRRQKRGTRYFCSCG